ncbi:MAG: GGDEF domain-containing protein, partial [Arcobacteraceae bacterium]
AQNNAKFIEKLLDNRNDFIEDIKKNKYLQNKIENQLKILITNNIKYAYLLYKDKNDTFRFLVDASDPSEKAFLNQKFDVESQVWFDIYRDKKPVVIKHELLRELSLSYIVPVLNKGEVQVVLAIDFSIHKIKHINNIIKLVKNGIITIFVVILLFIVILVLQKIKYNRVKKSAFIDKLTNVYNKNYLLEYQDTINLNQCIIAIVDIDHFKEVNDAYGHDVGDFILKEAAAIMKDTIRIANEDIIIRFGGEEFILLIKTSQIDKEAQLKVLTRILENVSTSKFSISSGEDISITVSIGVNSNPSKSKNFQDALKIADQSLYLAKNSGRNNIKIDNENKQV